MKRATPNTLLRTLSNGISALQMAILAAALMFTAGLRAAEPEYRDLRRIEPIHGDATAGGQKAAVCFACHGANGASVAPTFPRLAGQRIQYLYTRLVSFKRADPKDPYYSASAMTPNVATLNDNDMRNLAAFFSAQTPTVAAPAAPAEPADPGVKGQALYLTGDPTRGIPPCQGCHGAEASGPVKGSSQYPAYPSLRGQYAPYLVARLTSFRKGLPHDTTNDFIMTSVAQTLDDDSIQAIAAWLSSLTPVVSLW